MRSLPRPLSPIPNCFHERSCGGCQLPAATWPSRPPVAATHVSASRSAPCSSLTHMTNPLEPKRCMRSRGHIQRSHPGERTLPNPNEDMLGKLPYPQDRAPRVMELDEAYSQLTHTYSSPWREHAIASSAAASFSAGASPSSVGTTASPAAVVAASPSRTPPGAGTGTGIDLTHRALDPPVRPARRVSRNRNWLVACQGRCLQEAGWVASRESHSVT